eukprot:4742965-Prymnesium_polylepis.1
MDGDAAHVRFSTHDQAETCVSALHRAGRAADYTYNSTAYDRETGVLYSGWCTFEQGASTIVTSHLRVAQEKAYKDKVTLPERLEHAQASRRK